MADKLTLDRAAMKDRATSHLRIYVGGLQESATIDELYDHFIGYGQVNGIVINRGFGFVQFEEESSVQAAITNGNGSYFQGKPLNVKTAQTNPDNKRNEHEPVVIHPAKPHAGALSDNVNDDPADSMYDSHGNYIGDQSDRTEEGAPPGKRKRTRPKVRRRKQKAQRAALASGTGSMHDPTSQSESEPDSYNEDPYAEEYDSYQEGPGFPPRGEVRGRGRGMLRGRGRGARGRGGAPAPYDRPPIGGRDRGAGGYDMYGKPPHPRPLPAVLEKNDCEIIVVSKALTEYAEYIEGRLKRLGIVVDLLFPMEDVPIGKVLGNIASRGCLYAILIMPINEEKRSLTLTVLHGLPQEHRNMPIEEALTLLSRNFEEVKRGGGAAGREALFALLGQLADGRTLTTAQYNKVIEYLQEKRDQQIKVELGEATTDNSKAQTELQQRIMSILNEKKLAPEPVPAPAPDPAPAPAPASTPSPASAPHAQSKLLNDPTVRKALDSILQKFV